MVTNPSPATTHHHLPQPIPTCHNPSPSNASPSNPSPATTHHLPTHPHLPQRISDARVKKSLTNRNSRLLGRLRTDPAATSSAAQADSIAEEFGAFEGDVEMVVNNPIARIGGYAAGGSNAPSGPSQRKADPEEGAGEVEVVVAMGAARPGGGGAGSPTTDASGLNGLFSATVQAPPSEFELEATLGGAFSKRLSNLTMLGDAKKAGAQGEEQGRASLTGAGGRRSSFSAADLGGFGTPAGPHTPSFKAGGGGGVRAKRRSSLSASWKAPVEVVQAGAGRGGAAAEGSSQIVTASVLDET